MIDRERLTELTALLAGIQDAEQEAGLALDGEVVVTDEDGAAQVTVKFDSHERAAVVGVFTS